MTSLARLRASCCSPCRGHWQRVVDCVEPHPAGRRSPPTSRSWDDFFQVWVKPRREMVVRSAESAPTALKPDFEDGVETVTLNGEDWRVYAISDARGEIQVQVGEPTSALFDELKTALYYALGVSFLALMLVGLALKHVVRWSLKPVVTIQSAIFSRDALDLTPLPDKGLPDEVRLLVVSFNRLLSRLDGTLQAERRFFTEAAHELRTPLAVLLHMRKLHNVPRRSRKLKARWISSRGASSVVRDCRSSCWIRRASMSRSMSVSRRLSSSPISLQW